MISSHPDLVVPCSVSGNQITEEVTRSPATHCDPPALPQRDQWPFTQVTVHSGKRETQAFQGSELALRSEDQKCHHCPPASAGDLQEPDDKQSAGQGSTGSADPSGAIRLVPEHVIGVDALGSWHAPVLGPWPGVGATIVENATGEPVIWPLLSQAVQASRGGWSIVDPKDAVAVVLLPLYFTS